jgi:hypothetical protein
MAKASPHALAEEIAAERSPWAIYGARFACRLTRAASTPRIRVEHAWVELNKGRLACTLKYSGSAIQVQSAADAARRAGYWVGAQKGWFVARRSVRRGELGAEMRRLEGVARDPSSISAFPARSPRPTAFTKSPFPISALAHLRGTKGWDWEWVGVQRLGTPSCVDGSVWGAVTWCSLLIGVQEKSLNVGLQLFPKSSKRRVGGRDLGRARQCVRLQLEPLGYREIKVRRTREAPTLGIFEKDLPGLAAARRERARLDRLVFGR